MSERIEVRPWGHFVVLYEDESTWLKLLTIEPRQSLSLQKHEQRTEYWRTMYDGVQAVIESKLIPGHMPVKDLDVSKVYTVPAGKIHRLINPCDYPVTVLEWAVGYPSEDDIVRLSDNYGR